MRIFQDLTMHKRMLFAFHYSVAVYIVLIPLIIPQGNAKMQDKLWLPVSSKTNAPSQLFCSEGA